MLIVSQLLPTIILVLTSKKVLDNKIFELDFIITKIIIILVQLFVNTCMYRVI